MNKIVLAGAASLFALGLAHAQPAAAQNAATTGDGTSTAPGATGTAPPAPGSVPQATATTGGGAIPTLSDQAATTPPADTDKGPDKGANSFSESQAQGRISDAGYASVTDLKKDPDGIWHGKATKNGQSVDVWLDYKGHVGQS